MVVSVINKTKKLHSRAEQDHTLIVIFATGLAIAGAASSLFSMELRYVCGWVACSFAAYVLATLNTWPFDWLDDEGDFCAIVLGPLTLIAWILHGLISFMLLPFPDFKSVLKDCLIRVYRLIGIVLTQGTGLVLAWIVLDQEELSMSVAIIFAFFLITMGWLLDRQCKVYIWLWREERRALED